MSAFLGFLFVGLALLGALLLLGRPRSPEARAHELERAQMPRPLACGRLVFSEAEIACAGVAPMHGRLDQAFEYRGELHLVETKTRRRRVTYASDRVQLSAQAFVLQHLGYRVASTAWVRVHTRTRTHYVPMQLLHRQTVISLHARHRNLRLGASPKHFGPAALCRACGQRPRCTHANGANLLESATPSTKTRTLPTRQTRPTGT